MTTLLLLCFLSKTIAVFQITLRIDPFCTPTDPHYNVFTSHNLAVTDSNGNFIKNEVPKDILTKAYLTNYIGDSTGKVWTSYPKEQFSTMALRQFAFCNQTEPPIYTLDGNCPDELKLTVTRECCAENCKNWTHVIKTSPCGLLPGLSRYSRSIHPVTRVEAPLVTYKMCGNYTPMHTNFPPPFNFSNIGMLRKRNELVTVIYKNGNVTMFPQVHGNYVISLISDTIVSLECSATCTLEVPKNWTRETFLVYVYSGPALVFKEEYPYKFTTVCQVSHCFFCMENFESFDCLSYGNKVAIILAVVFGGIMVILTLGLCVVTTRATYNLPPGSVALVILLIPLVAACDSNLIISGNQVDCVINGLTEECKIITQSLITMPTLGSTICLTVLNENSNLVMGYINITYVQALAVTGLSLEYWTANRQIQSASTKPCGGDPYCSAEIHCNTKRTEVEKVNMGGALKGPAVTFPGVSSCNDGCGCWACNCAQCQEACVYHRWAVQPVPSLWRVLEVTSSRLVPHIKVCYGTVEGENLCDVKAFHAGNSQIFGGNFTLTYIGSFQTSFNFLGNRLMVDETRNTAYFVEASQKNVPIAGTPGELQANTYDDLAKPTPFSFIFAQDICRTYISDSLGYADCVAPPLGAITGEGQLPKIIDGISWSYSTDDTLVGDVLVPPGLSMTMITNGEVLFKTTRTQVCPDLTFIKMTGSWGTSEPAKITILGKSTCLPGKCVLSTYSTKITLQSVSLDLELEEKELSVLFHSNDKLVNFELFCKSLSIEAVVEIVGELDDPKPITPLEPEVSPDGFNQFFDRLSLGGKIGFSIGVGLGGLLFIILMIVLLCYTPEIVLCCHKTYNKAKGYNKVKKEEEMEIIESDSEKTQPTVEESTDQDDFRTAAQRIRDKQIKRMRK
jgi:hypothetical protein